MGLINPIEKIPENIYNAKVNICQLSNMCDLVLISRFKYMDKNKILCNHNSGIVFSMEGYELGGFRNKIDISLAIEGRFMPNGGYDPTYKSIPISLANLYLFIQLANIAVTWVTDPEVMNQIFKTNGPELLLTENGKEEVCLTMRLDEYDIQLRPSVSFIRDKYYKVIQILVSDKDCGFLYTNVMSFTWCMLVQILNNLDIVSAGIGILNLYGPTRYETNFEDRRKVFAPKIEAVRYDSINNENKVRTRKIAAE